MKRKYLYRIFCFLVGVTGFATLLPEIAEILGNQPKYNGTYKVSISLCNKEMHSGFYPFNKEGGIMILFSILVLTL